MDHRPTDRGAVRAALPLAALLSLAAAGAAQAYVGPGAGLTAIGTVLALVGAVLLAVIGFIWYPLKRLLRRSPAPAQTTAQTTAPPTGNPEDPAR